MSNWTDEDGNERDRGASKMGQRCGKWPERSSRRVRATQRRQRIMCHHYNARHWLPPTRPTPCSRLPFFEWEITDLGCVYPPDIVAVVRRLHVRDFCHVSPPTAPRVYNYLTTPILANRNGIVCPFVSWTLPSPSNGRRPRPAAFSLCHQCALTLYWPRNLMSRRLR